MYTQRMTYVDDFEYHNEGKAEVYFNSLTRKEQNRQLQIIPVQYFAIKCSSLQIKSFNKYKSWYLE